MTATLLDVLYAMGRRGAGVFTGDYNLNLVGLRSQPGTPNAFDDLFTCFYRVGDAWQFNSWPCTTDPGWYWLQHPMRVEGTAILQPRQYRSCWTIGLHRQQYEALVQRAPGAFRVWRDRDGDGSPDYSGPTYTDAAGINCHHAGTNSTRVDKWSAGCQVFQRTADHDALMALAHRQFAAGHGPNFSYTLLDWPT